MAARQRLRLAVISASINRPDRMDHVFRRQIAAGRDDGLSRREHADFADDLPAFRENCRSTGLMNRTIDSAATKQGRVRRVHNCIGCLGSDVGRPVNLDSLSAIE